MLLDGKHQMFEGERPEDIKELPIDAGLDFELPESQATRNDRKVQKPTPLQPDRFQRTREGSYEPERGGDVPAYVCDLQDAQVEQKLELLSLPGAITRPSHPVGAIQPQLYQIRGVDYPSACCWPAAGKEAETMLSIRDEHLGDQRTRVTHVTLPSAMALGGRSRILLGMVHIWRKGHG